MKVITETNTKSLLSWAPVLLGTALMILSGMIRIPCYPVSFTMHTCAVFLIGATQTPQKAFLSVALFLALGCVELLPTPLHLFGKCGGYYLSFPLAASLVALLRDHFSLWIALACGQMLIYTLGLLGLLPFIGLYQAVTMGVLIFLPSDVLKLIFAHYTARRFACTFPK